MVFFPDNFFPLLFVWSFSDWTEIREKMQGIAKFRANRLFCGREMMNNYLSMVNKIFHYRFSLLWFVSWVTEWWNLTGNMKQKKKQERNIKSMFIAYQYLTLVVSFSFRRKANTSSVNNTSRTKKKKKKTKT